jgi:hypothetical protein
LLAKTKPADLAVNFGKLVITKQEFKKIRGEIRENSPGATILPLRNEKREQLNIVDLSRNSSWAATIERAFVFWFSIFVFGGFGLLTLFAVLWALMSLIVGAHEVSPLPFGAP